jgi:GDP-D-mannose dehydratase
MMTIKEKCEQFWNANDICNEEMHAILEWIHKRYSEVEAELAKKDEEIARLRKALEFYADPNTYAVDFDPKYDKHWHIKVIHDDGFKARQALAPEKEKEKKGKCICAELLNFELDAVPNPDCPIHGAGFSWGKEKEE